MKITIELEMNIDCNIKMDKDGMEYAKNLTCACIIVAIQKSRLKANKIQITKIKTE